MKIFWSSVSQYVECQLYSLLQVLMDYNSSTPNTIPLTYNSTWIRQRVNLGQILGTDCKSCYEFWPTSQTQRFYWCIKVYVWRTCSWSWCVYLDLHIHSVVLSLRTFTNIYFTNTFIVSSALNVVTEDTYPKKI